MIPLIFFQGLLCVAHGFFRLIKGPQRGRKEAVRREEAGRERGKKRGREEGRRE